MQSIIMQTYIVMYSTYWLQQHMIYTILYIHTISAIQEVLSSTLKLKYLNLLHEEPFQPFQSESSRSIESHISSTHKHTLWRTYTHNVTHTQWACKSSCRIESKSAGQKKNESYRSSSKASSQPQQDKTMRRHHNHNNNSDSNYNKFRSKILSSLGLPRGAEKGGRRNLDLLIVCK